MCFSSLPLQFDVTVRVSDVGGLSETATYTFDVMNSNDPPTFANVTVNIDFADVVPDAFITVLSALDPDGARCEAGCV